MYYSVAHDGITSKVCPLSLEAASLSLDVNECKKFASLSYILFDISTHIYMSTATNDQHGFIPQGANLQDIPEFGQPVSTVV